VLAVVVGQAVQREQQAQILCSIQQLLPVVVVVVVVRTLEMVCLVALAVAHLIQVPLVLVTLRQRIHPKVTTEEQIQVVTMAGAGVVAHLRLVHLFPVLLVVLEVTEALGL